MSLIEQYKMERGRMQKVIQAYVLRLKHVYLEFFSFILVYFLIKKTILLLSLDG